MIRQSVLTGLSTATNAVITAADTVLTALGKLQAQMPLAATLTTLGTIKANISLVQRTPQPISVAIPTVSVIGASLLSSVSVTVTGV